MPTAIIAVIDLRHDAKRLSIPRVLMLLRCITGSKLTNLWYTVHLSLTGYQRAWKEQLEHLLAVDPLLPDALNHYGARKPGRHWSAG
jgi:hypothetical protein